jgi:hypothetical protein
VTNRADAEGEETRQRTCSKGSTRSRYRDGADDAKREAVLLLRLAHQEPREELVTRRERRKVGGELDTIRTRSHPTVV